MADSKKTDIVWLEMKDTDKWQCYDHFRPFFALFMFIFHKTGSDGHFRCLTVLNYDWFESYNTNIFIFAFFGILYKIKHFRFCIFAFCVIRLVKYLKMTIWIPVLWKKTWSWQKNWPVTIFGSLPNLQGATGYIWGREGSIRKTFGSPFLLR